MNETQTEIIESAVAYALDQEQSPESASQNAFDTAMERGLSREQASEVSTDVYVLVDAG